METHTCLVTHTHCVAKRHRKSPVAVAHADDIYETRKLSYRKDDSAMRPENFRESLSTPTATFAEIFNGLLFRSIL